MAEQMVAGLNKLARDKAARKTPDQAA